ncbi:MAG: Nif3-like dinuclear metal center hexameric protein [Candidatus Marinimicrobia bacterium]|nr:Nif3-like dinuclear metal center hexameric protein [Candidatus Neomarinimicrobiota bacterium]
MTPLKILTHFLDRELDTPAFDDVACNGLQVQNSGRIRRIATGVDASLEFFAAAVEQDANLLICHHGLSWGDSLRRITDSNYRRLKFLLDHDLALYASHLPLDAHPQLGNNAGICRALGLRHRRPFGNYRGRPIGFAGRLDQPVTWKSFQARAQRIFGRAGVTFDFGARSVRTIGVVSGGAADCLEEAVTAGLDAFISGEPQLPSYHLAREAGINALFAGHYATETFGVRALAERLHRRFKLPAAFIPFDIAL